MFGGSMFRDFENDPFFSDMHEQHRSMMGSMFNDPFFASQRNPTMAIEGGRQRRDLAQPRSRQADPFAMSPFGMMGGFGSMFGSMNAMMGNMRQNFERMANDPNSHSYSSSTVMSYSNTGDGAPKVYQASTSTRQTPGGVKETRRSVRDSARGVQKMSIGHHMGDRAHIIEKSKDASTGQLEENQEFVNLDEQEADTFNQEFTRRTRGTGAYPNHSLSGPIRHSHSRRDLLALPDSRREHRGSHARHNYSESTPPRPSGASKGGRRYDNYDREGRRHDKYSKPYKADKSVHF